MIPDDPRPINASEWGKWMGEGSVRWKLVGRSLVVFQRNTTELIDHLKLPSANPFLAIQLMNDDGEATQPYWDELDQRLHNEASSAVTLVSHTARLLKHYEHDVPKLVAEYHRRNAIVMQMNETRFIRDLRNYLLKYSVADVVQVLTFKAQDGNTMAHTIKLPAKYLLQWDRWTRCGDYLKSFADGDGPVIGRDVAAYANAMMDLFRWLFSQRLAALQTYPDRYRIGDLTPAPGSEK